MNNLKNKTIFTKNTCVIFSVVYNHSHTKQRREVVTDTKALVASLVGGSRQRKVQ